MSRQATETRRPKLALRSRLHAAGTPFSCRSGADSGLRRKADIVFTRRRVAVFVDGCFWHCCPEHGTMPASNAEWWETKLRRNVDRDAETNRLLIDAGWTVVRVWEHEDVDVAALIVEETVHREVRAFVAHWVSGRHLRRRGQLAGAARLQAGL